MSKKQANLLCNKIEKYMENEEKMRADRKRINVTYDIDTYEKIKAIAHKENRDMSDVVREWTIQALNGTVTEQNLEVIIPALREVTKSVIEPIMERQIALTAKTCIQAGTAAYLSADAILKFVPREQREEVRESYEKARKQAVAYMKSHVNMEEN